MKVDWYARKRVLLEKAVEGIEFRSWDDPEEIRLWEQRELRQPPWYKIVFDFIKGKDS